MKEGAHSARFSACVVHQKLFQRFVRTTLAELQAVRLWSRGSGWRGLSQRGLWLEVDKKARDYGRAAFLRVEVRVGRARVGMRDLTGFNSA